MYSTTVHVAAVHMNTVVSEKETGGWKEKDGGKEGGSEEGGTNMSFFLLDFPLTWMHYPTDK